MSKVTLYDCAIIGGGIAGLSLAIMLAKAGKSVILFEQKKYPFHKVSGGYFSNEGIDFLFSLGVNLIERKLPAIERMIMSSPNGQSINVKLDVGGVGISRYELDNELYHLAVDAGVEVRTEVKVRQVKFEDQIFHVCLENETIDVKVAVGAFGRSSNMDVSLGRNYKAQRPGKLFVAVEHHIKIPFDPHFVEIHAFPGGYCGISAYGNGMVNLSYTTKASNIKAHNGISGLEKSVLSENKFLVRYFNEGVFLLPKPQTISHVFFEIKEPVNNHILMIGDAAGNIAPISGNGMSIGVHSAKLAGEAIIRYLNAELSLAQMEQKYSKEYYQHFAKRIKVSKQLTHLLINPMLTNSAFPLFKLFPFLVDYVSKQIHGGKI